MVGIELGVTQIYEFDAKSLEVERERERERERETWFHSEGKEKERWSLFPASSWSSVCSMYANILPERSEWMNSYAMIECWGVQFIQGWAALEMSSIFLRHHATSGHSVSTTEEDEEGEAADSMETLKERGTEFVCIVCGIGRAGQVSSSLLLSSFCCWQLGTQRSSDSRWSSCTSFFFSSQWKIIWRGKKFYRYNYPPSFRSWVLEIPPNTPRPLLHKE